MRILINIHKTIVNSVRCTQVSALLRTAWEVLYARYSLLYGRSQARAANFNVLRAGDVIPNVLLLSLHEADGVVGQRL